MPEVGRQQKNLKIHPDEYAGSWRTTEKLTVKEKLFYIASLFEWDFSSKKTFQKTLDMLQ